MHRPCGGPAGRDTAGRAAATVRRGPRLTTAASSARAWGLALGSLGAVGFSGKAIIVKLAFRHGVDAVTLIMYRMLFALPLFVALAWWAGRGRPRLTRQDALAIGGLGFSGYYLASFLDFAGLAYISAGLERLVLYLNPTLVLLLGRVFYKRQIRARQWLAMGLGYLGVLLVFGQEAGFAGPHVALGLALVFASAISYAVYLVCSAEAVRRLGALRLAGWATSVACLLCIVQFVLLRPLTAATAVAPAVLWLSVLNAVACTFVPVLMVMMAIERLGSTLVAQTGMIGPVSTLLLSVPILGERFTATAALGAGLVLGGVGLLARTR